MRAQRKPPAEAEKNERRRAVQSAAGSLKIEGLESAPAEALIYERYINGELELNDILKALKLRESFNREISFKEAVEMNLQKKPEKLTHE